MRRVHALHIHLNTPLNHFLGILCYSTVGFAAALGAHHILWVTLAGVGTRRAALGRAAAQGIAAQRRAALSLSLPPVRFTM
jgi:hypothetical protein